MYTIYFYVYDYGFDCFLCKRKIIKFNMNSIMIQEDGVNFFTH